MIDSLAGISLQRSSFTWLVALALPALLVSRRLLSGRRAQKISRTQERVLILGASSGIGRALALEYAGRGARICVVARREDALKAVVEKCGTLYPNRASEESSGKAGGKSVSSVKADFASVEDMVGVRTVLEKEWQGVDTIIVCAGVSALRPLMEVAGLERDGRTFNPPQATIEGIQQTVDVASAAARTNYFGPLVSAVTFIPLLQATSAAPSVLLVSSLAALVPPPTRSLYASTKAASLMLYQVLAIEHPSIAFSLAIPATVQGDFRASAVDGGPIREADPNTHGLRPEDVARRCTQAIDAGEKFVFMPLLFSKFGHLLYWVFPSFVEWRARIKYNFTV